MTCDRNHPCDGSSIAKALDYESSNVSQMLLDAAGIHRDPRAMQNLVADIQRREDPAKGDNLEVARDGRLLISKFNGSVEVLPIDVTGARIRGGSAPAGHNNGDYRGPGHYENRQAAGVADYAQRGIVGAIAGAAINGRDRGKGAIQGGVGAVGGKAVREATGQEGATGAVVEGLGACAAGALIGGKDGCKNGVTGSVIGQGLDWLTNKKRQ